MFTRPALLAATVLALPAALAITPTVAVTSDADLIHPGHVAATNTPQAAVAVLAAHRYATLWHTGDARYVTEALSPSFVNHTLPVGRVQSTRSPLDVSEVFRMAVPGMRAEIEDIVIAGDRVSVYLRFCGYFTGEFSHTRGQNQPIDFQAFNLYRIADGEIAENWHLGDNQTLLRQMDLQP